RHWRLSPLLRQRRSGRAYVPPDAARPRGPSVVGAAAARSSPPAGQPVANVASDSGRARRPLDCHQPLAGTGRPPTWSNGAWVYGLEHRITSRCAFSRDDLVQRRKELPTGNALYGPKTRREFLALSRGVRT